MGLADGLLGAFRGRIDGVLAQIEGGGGQALLDALLDGGADLGHAVEALGDHGIELFRFLPVQAGALQLVDLSADQAQERGDEAEALCETVRAVELDRAPLPQLSPGAWQLKERGIEVAAVQLWREVKAQAVEVARVAERLSSQVREWLGRTVERLAPGHELAHAGGGQRREQWELADRGLDHSVAQELAARLRAAHEAQQDRGKAELGKGRASESARGLAERLREAARSIDPAAADERAASLQQERLAEERQRVQETERIREQERVREQERRGHERDLGSEYGL